MEDKTTLIFRDAPVSKAVFTNAVPSIVSMIMVLIYNLADTFFIGQTHEPLMVAAVSIATPVFLIFMAVGMIFGVGGTSLIARTLGQGNRRKVKNVSSFCFWSSLVLGVISMFIIWLFHGPICRAVGASDDTLRYASQYLNIVAVGIPSLILGGCFSNVIRAEGKPNLAMMGMLLGNLLNIILDPILILFMGWNVAGAAAATVIGTLFSAVFYVVHLCSKDTLLSIRPRYYRMGNHIAKDVFAIGIPASLNNILMSISNMLLNGIMIQYGDMVVAGLGVALKVNMIAVMLLLGLGVGVQPILGFCFGAGNKKRYMEVLRFSLLVAFVMSAVMTIICYCGARPLVTAFLGTSDAFEFGVAFARIYIYSGPIIGILFIFVNAIQSTGAAIPALILSISRQGLVYIPILFIFNHLFSNPTLICLVQPITDYFTVILAAVLFFITYKVYFKWMGPRPSEKEKPVLKSEEGLTV